LTCARGAPRRPLSARRLGLLRCWGLRASGWPRVRRDRHPLRHRHLQRDQPRQRSLRRLHPRTRLLLAGDEGLPQLDLRGHRECRAAGGITPGVQIISMVDPENPVLVATYGTNSNRSHTVQVDTSRAILICNGRTSTTALATFRRACASCRSRTRRARSRSRRGRTAALLPDPAYYIHDCVVAGQPLYGRRSTRASNEFSTSPRRRRRSRSGAWTYPGAYYTHSAWPTAARDRLYVCDEQNGQTLRVFDIANENVRPS